MTRSKIFALCALFALGACAGNRPSFQPLQTTSAIETVGDAAAAVAHSATDSDVTAAALNATNAFGAPLRNISTSNPIWPLVAGSTPNGVCRDGVESFVPDRSGDPDSQEVAQYRDRQCTNMARVTVAILRSASPSSETIDRSTWMYGNRSTSPSALRESITIVTGASIDPSGHPAQRDGYVVTTSTRLSVGNRVQSVAGLQEVAVAGNAAHCEAAAGYDVAGVPSLDATFGWQSASVENTPRDLVSANRAVVLSNQTGRLFVGPIGSLSISGGALQPSCPIARPAYTLSGGDISGTFKMAAQAAFHNGKLSSLRVAGGSMSGGYRFDAWTDAKPRGAAGERHVHAVLSNEQSHIAVIDVDRFGDGAMTVTQTGEQYRLIDWTVVR
jgi:hypothetical protein